MRERIQDIKMVLWNIAGLKKKERKFWKYLERFDVIGLYETWIEKEKEKKKEKKKIRRR